VFLFLEFTLKKLVIMVAETGFEPMTFGL